MLNKPDFIIYEDGIRRYILKCPYCENEFHRKSFRRKFCSVSYRVSYYNKKRIWTDDSKKKISMSNKGRLSGIKNPNYSGAFKIFICRNCSIDFKVSLNNLNAGKKKGFYCSIRCHQEFCSNNKMSDMQNRIYKVWSRNIHKAIKRDTAWVKWTNILGYSLKELMDHLESKFIDGMSWDNYGRFGWHIDHIKPSSLFKYESIDDDEFKKCWSLNNLQPLWWRDNISKGGKNRIKNYEAIFRN